MDSESSGMMFVERVEEEKGVRRALEGAFVFVFVLVFAFARNAKLVALAAVLSLLFALLMLMLLVVAVGVCKLTLARGFILMMFVTLGGLVLRGELLL